MTFFLSIARRMKHRFALFVWIASFAVNAGGAFRVTWLKIRSIVDIVADVGGAISVALMHAGMLVRIRLTQ